MPTERLSMRKSKEILRLKLVEQHRRHRHIARTLSVSLGEVTKVLQRAIAAELDWAKVEPMAEAELERTLYGENRESAQRRCPIPASYRKN